MDNNFACYRKSFAALKEYFEDLPINSQSLKVYDQVLGMQDN